MIIVVTGPSGCGKSTLIRRAQDGMAGLLFAVSHTTRPPRRSEVDGREYHFVSESRFRKMAAAGRFAEWAVVHGHLYGTSVKELKDKGRGGDVVLDIDIQGARQISGKFPESVFIFVLPPVFEELKRRLEGRGEDGPATIAARLERAREEIKDYRRFDYLVINDDLERAVQELISIIRGQRCRRERREVAVRSVLKSFGLDRAPSPRKKG